LAASCRGFGGCSPATLGLCGRVLGRRGRYPGPKTGRSLRHCALRVPPSAPGCGLSTLRRRGVASLARRRAGRSATRFGPARVSLPGSDPRACPGRSLPCPRRSEDLAPGRSLPCPGRQGGRQRNRGTVSLPPCLSGPCPRGRSGWLPRLCLCAGRALRFFGWLLVGRVGWLRSVFSLGGVSCWFLVGPFLLCALPVVWSAAGGCAGLSLGRGWASSGFRRSSGCSAGGRRGWAWSSAGFRCLLRRGRRGRGLAAPVAWWSSLSRACRVGCRFRPRVSVAWPGAGRWLFRASALCGGGGCFVPSVLFCRVFLFLVPGDRCCFGSARRWGAVGCAARGFSAGCFGFARRRVGSCGCGLGCLLGRRAFLSCWFLCFGSCWVLVSLGAGSGRAGVAWVVCWAAALFSLVGSCVLVLSRRCLLVLVFWFSPGGVSCLLLWLLVLVGCGVFLLSALLAAWSPGSSPLSCLPAAAWLLVAAWVRTRLSSPPPWGWVPLPPFLLLSVLAGPGLGAARPSRLSRPRLSAVARFGSGLAVPPPFPWAAGWRPGRALWCRLCRPGALPLSPSFLLLPGRWARVGLALPLLLPVCPFSPLSWAAGLVAVRGCPVCWCPGRGCRPAAPAFGPRPFVSSRPRDCPGCVSRSPSVFGPAAFFFQENLDEHQHYSL
jgi:hypothetical protein